MAQLIEDTLLSRRTLKPDTYAELISLLSKNQVWRKVAEAVGIFSGHDLQRFGWTTAPAETLIYELEARLCTINSFCEILKECHLYEILMLFKNYEPIRILKQPGNGKQNKMVLRGMQLKLTCKAVGLPFPNYQWYYNNRVVESCKESTLVIKNFGLGNEGEYYCVVSQEGGASVLSNSVNATLAPEKPVIVKQPVVSAATNVGERVVLEVVAKGHPTVKYQWYKGNQQLDGSCESQLNLLIESENQEGKYRCYIYNIAGEIWSNEIIVTVRKPCDSVPSAKIALLIGNQMYENLDCLRTPENDVKTLAVILKGLGFHTIALQNLNLVEMRNVINYFGKILPKDAYVVFYFSGHGFELCDKSMMPVDVPGPENYLRSNAFSERELLRIVLSSQPKVFLELLDMCLKPPEPSNRKIFEEKASLCDFQANRNLIQGYATTSYSEAYEKKSEENGFYVKYLKEYFTKRKDMPIVEMLRNIGKDIAMVCPLQKPYFGTNVVLDYRLTDESLENCDLREKMEAISRVPEDFLLRFEQVQITSEVTFAPFMGVFFNTLEVKFTNLHNFKVSCEYVGEELQFELFRIDGDVFIKIMNIQKLKSNKKLTLWLSERNGHLRDCAVWHIGKPLIAAADLGCKTSGERTAAGDGAAAQSMIRERGERAENMEELENVITERRCGIFSGGTD